MITRTMTITLDGSSKEEYEAIKAKLAAEGLEAKGWKLIYEPLVNRVTAAKTEDVTAPV